MSEILTTLREAGENLIDGKGSELIDDMLSDTAGLVEEHVPPELKDSALEGVEILKGPEVKAAALNLTKAGLVKVIGLFEDGQASEAKRLYMATEASTQERIDFQNASGDAAELLHAKREAEWDALVEALTRIGKVALKALGMLALGAIGL